MAGETAWLLFRQLYTALGTSYWITLGFLRTVMMVMIDFARRNEMFFSPTCLLSALLDSFYGCSARRIRP